MKFFALIALVIAVCGLVQAGEKCTLNGKTLEKGETYQPPGKCEFYECFGKNGIIAKSCPQENTLKPCKYVPEDNSKPYPKCCAHYDC